MTLPIARVRPTISRSRVSPHGSMPWYCRIPGYQGEHGATPKDAYTLWYHMSAEWPEDYGIAVAVPPNVITVPASSLIMPPAIRYKTAKEILEDAGFIVSETTVAPKEEPRVPARGIEASPGTSRLWPENWGEPWVHTLAKAQMTFAELCLQQWPSENSYLNDFGSNK